MSMSYIATKSKREKKNLHSINKIRNLITENHIKIFYKLWQNYAKGNIIVTNAMCLYINCLVILIIINGNSHFGDKNNTF